MNHQIVGYIAVMAMVTYLIRSLPLVLFRKKITSPFVKSFLYYIPYAVLGAMTIPGIFYSTASVFSATMGLAAAIILSYFNRSLIVVAILSSLTAYIAEVLQNLLL